jgi:hypothetical protein
MKKSDEGRNDKGKNDGEKKGTSWNDKKRKYIRRKFQKIRVWI